MKKYGVSGAGIVINGLGTGGVFETSWPWGLFFVALAAVNGYVIVYRAGEM